MEIVQVFLLSRGRESKDMDGRRLFCLKAKSSLMLYQSDEIKSTLPASQSFYCSTSFYQFMDIIHLHMFFIESAGFFVLLMYERFGMGVGVEMGICIKHSCVLFSSIYC